MTKGNLSNQESKLIPGGGEEAISFNVFINGGFIVLLEAGSTASWPEDEDNIVFAISN